MSIALSPSELSGGTERRREVRVTFSPTRRPQLRLPDGLHDVLDASTSGLRVRHTDPVRPSVGDQIVGGLQLQVGERPITIQGIIVRVAPAHLAVTCADGVVPAAWIMQEAARRRDAFDDREEMPLHD